MTNTKFTFNLDKDLKDEATRVFNSMEMDLSTGIRIYLSQVVRDQELPFTPSLNTSNQQARKEALKGDTIKFENFESFKDYVDNI